MFNRFTFISLALIFTAFSASARDQIRIVGSSTVYPFSTIVAEEFGRLTKFKTPIIESTGTGGGLKLFCSGAGEDTPDFTGASRAIKASEVELCKKNGIDGITEINIGYDGIVLASSIESKPISLSKEEVFSALAQKVAKDGVLIDNPYTHWNQINPSLPKKKIEVYGPPPTSGTRDAFVELVMEKACIDVDAFKKAYPNKKERAKSCHLLREDGHFIEAGENDNLIVQKLRTNDVALGIFGYSFLEQNPKIIQGATINGVAPSFETISDGSYSVSRPLYLYMKNAHAKIIPGMKEFADEFLSENAIGDEGYLTFKGLIPLSEEAREKIIDAVGDAF